MASTPKKMADSQYLPNAAATVYTVGASVKQATVKEIWLCNTGASAQTVTLYLVPSAGVAGGSNTLLSGYTLQAGESQRMSCSSVMYPGDFISWLANIAATIVGRISGIEYT